MSKSTSKSRSESGCAHCQIIPSSVFRKLALHPRTAPVPRDALLDSAEPAAFARGERSATPLAAFALAATAAGHEPVKHRDVFAAGGSGARTSPW
jgi:hypothetical protein